MSWGDWFSDVSKDHRALIFSIKKSPPPQKKKKIRRELLPPTTGRLPAEDSDRLCYVCFIVNAFSKIPRVFASTPTANVQRFVCSFPTVVDTGLNVRGGRGYIFTAR